MWNNRERWNRYIIGRNKAIPVLFHSDSFVSKIKHFKEEGQPENYFQI